MDFHSRELGIRIGYGSEEIFSNKKFVLHDHRNYHEIYIFFQGDADFLVEGTRYVLHPGDIILAQGVEMHHVHHKSFGTYERMIIHLEPKFFYKHDCEDYQDIFLNRTLGSGNCIPAQVSAENGIPALLDRMKTYLEDEGDRGRAAVGTLLELLYFLNHVNGKNEKVVFQNEQIKGIILYINQHLREPMPLQEIADAFYMTKCHLCRNFKKHTGYTINQYITHKRLQLARELAGEGLSWTEASMEAGFGNYSNFYKLFCRIYGHAPSKT